MGLLETIRRKRLSEVELARVDYRTILLRADTPEPGDDDRVMECARVLGRSPNDVESDIKLLRELEETSAAAAPLEETKKAYYGKKYELNQVDLWCKSERDRIWREAEAKREAIRRSTVPFSQAWRAAREADDRLGDLIDEARKRNLVD